MKRIVLFTATLASIGCLGAMLTTPALAQDPTGVLDAPKLRTMLTGMGYEVTDISTETGKEKYSFVIKTSKFNIPVGAEVSPSKNYIWLTANLGKTSSSTKWEKLLRANANIQPTQFYATKSDTLMIGLAVENHEVTPAGMKKQVDRFTKNVDDESEAWQSN